MNQEVALAFGKARHARPQEVALDLGKARHEPRGGTLNRTRKHTNKQTNKQTNSEAWISNRVKGPCESMELRIQVAPEKVALDLGKLFMNGPST